MESPLPPLGWLTLTSSQWVRIRAWQELATIAALRLGEFGWLVVKLQVSIEIGPAFESRSRGGLEGGALVSPSRVTAWSAARLVTVLPLVRSAVPGTAPAISSALAWTVNPAY